MDRQNLENGFVLPYVLVVIAILAIAGTIAAQRLTNAANVVSQLEMKAHSERILQSAEAATLYSLLTANPIEGGYDLSPNSPIVWEFGLMSADGRTVLGSDAENTQGLDFWPANGSIRQYSLTPVETSPRTALREDTRSAPDAVVRLQDASGLVSLNSGNPQFIAAVLKASGASTLQARRLIDTLKDYTDVDNRRRNDGAEVNEYRRAGMSTPSNSELRNHQELAAILQWRDSLKNINTRDLADLTTTINTIGYREAFAPPQLQTIINGSALDSPELEQNDFISNLERQASTMSGHVRVSFYAKRADGQYDKRVVDFSRFLGGIGVPYRRHWVYDATVLERDLKINDDSTRTPDGEALNLNGLKHVVHTASSAR